MDVVIAVSLTLLLIVGVFTIVFSIATKSHHLEDDE